MLSPAGGPAAGDRGDIWSNWQTVASQNNWAGWTDFGGNGLKFYAGHADRLSARLKKP